MHRRVYIRPGYSQSVRAVMLQSKEELSNPSSRQSISFRRRFRLSYPVFLDLELVHEHRWLTTKTDGVAGEKVHPLGVAGEFHQSLSDERTALASCCHLLFAIPTDSQLQYS